MSEFEKFARSQGFSGDFQRGCNGQYKSDLLHFMEKAFMHQQAKIDELEKQNQKLQKQFNFLLDKNIRDESAHASLKLRVMRVSHLMDKAAENGTECVDIGSLYDALIKDGDLDQSLRGEYG